MSKQYFDVEENTGNQSSKTTMDSDIRNGQLLCGIIGVLVFMFLIATAVFGVIRFHKADFRMTHMETEISLLNTDTLINGSGVMMIKDSCNNLMQDRLVLIHPSELKNIISESTQKSFDTYVTSLGALLGIVTFLITFVTVVIPLIMNSYIRRSTNDYLKKRLKYLNENMADRLKTMDKNLEDKLEDLTAKMDKAVYKNSNDLNEKVGELVEKLNTISQGSKKEIVETKMVVIDDIKKAHSGNAEEIVKGMSGLDEQINGYVNIIEKAPNEVTAEVYYNLGILYKEKGDYDQSKLCFENAISKMPKYVEAYKELAEIFIILSNAESEEVLKKNNLNNAWGKIETAMALGGYNDGISLMETRCKIFIAMMKYEAALKDINNCIGIASKINLVHKVSDWNILKEDINKKYKEITQSNEVELITIHNYSFLMKKVAGGAFFMGATNSDQEAIERERPGHRILLDDYYISETVVTQEFWELVMGHNPSKNVGKDLPVENISWNESQEFVKRLNKISGLEFQLPTEAQWEFAARGGNKSKGFKYSGSNNLDDVAWYWKNSGLRPIEENDDCWDMKKIKEYKCKTHSVKKKRPNELGLYDMSGNVWEWCYDLFGDYNVNPQINPTGAKEGQCRVVRGGSWNSEARHCRVLRRSYIDPNDCRDYLGFRLILSHN